MPDRTVIQWDKDDLEELGLFKVDLLGLGALNAAPQVLRPAARAQAARLSLATIPAEDPAIYDMICAGDTVGVFQIESRAQMAMLPRLKPRDFYDLVIEVASCGRADHRRHGPSLSAPASGEEARRLSARGFEPVLEKTLGVPLFQEQVMRLAMVAADYTPGEADQLRRDMAAWQHGADRAAPRALVSRMQGKGSRGIRRARLRADSRLRRVRLPREPCRQFRPDRLRDRLDQAPLRRVHLLAAERAADGLLHASDDRRRREAPSCHRADIDVACSSGLHIGRPCADSAGASPCVWGSIYIKGLQPNRCQKIIGAVRP